MAHISVILAEKILALLEESGASDCEQGAALGIVRLLQPFQPNGASTRLAALAQHEPERSDSKQ